jgi:hypothetical protein
MVRMMIDCRDMPSESNCTLAIAGDDIEDLLDAAVSHAASKHGDNAPLNYAKAFAVGSSLSRRPCPEHDCPSWGPTLTGIVSPQ